MKTGVPVTRENWIKMNWLDDPPKEWSPELEEQLPPELRLST